MWKNQSIELATQKALKDQLGPELGEELYARYLTARKALVEDVLPYIVARQPNLTDHSENHVADVFKNIESLLGKSLKSFSGVDLYFLSLSTLFHDTGNIFDRVNHQTTWSDIYSHIFSGSNDRQEKFILGKIIGAHCGEAQDGTMDTLRLLEEISHHKSQKVATRKIATILRFADELAEGQQRTSLFMQKHFGFPKDSQVYHEFAKSVDRYGIDPENERIALIFNFSLEKAALQDPDWETNIRNLIKFSYKRIAKLDQERQYARYYCDFLMPFKRTTVSTHFWIEDKMLDLNLDDITLTDIIVPGADVGKEISTINPRYELDGIVSQIKDALEKV